MDLRQGGRVVTVASGLSCPEGVGLDGIGNLYVVENPVGDECKGSNLTKAARLTKVELSSGAKTTVGPLNSPHGMDVQCDAFGCFAYVCEWGAHAITRTNLKTGRKDIVGPIKSPSGCAIDNQAGYAYAVEQGENDGQVLRFSLHGGAKQPPFVLVKDLAGPMGLAVDAVRPT